MSLSVVNRSSANRDIVGAFDWYEQQAPGLGAQFIFSLDACLAGVARKPELYPMVYKNQRRAILRRFPYCVFYIIEDERIVVTAVLHAKRDPHTWQHRG